MKQYHEQIFKEYYYENKGTLFKSFSIKINSFYQEYDIYWGNPEIIFDYATRKYSAPLAVRIMPTRLNAPNPRIFVHEELTQENGKVFDLVLSHEIGHLWLDDVVGLSRPSAQFFVDANQAEVWADYFAYCYFKKYRNLNSIEGICSIMKDAGILQCQLYNREPTVILQGIEEKIVKLEELNKNFQNDLSAQNPVICQIAEAIEITLNAIGDILSE